MGNEIKIDSYKIVRLTGIIFTILAIIFSWVFAFSSMHVHVTENTKHLSDLEVRMRVVEKNTIQINALLGDIDKKLDKIDKRLDR